MKIHKKVRIGNCILCLADCSTLLPNISADLAIVTDPPYGISNNANYKRFSGGIKGHARRKDGTGGVKYSNIAGDDKPFDPSLILRFRECIIWGLNNYVGLPSGGALVWVKRKPEAFGTFLSDAELAWVKGSKGVYCFTSFPQKMARQRYHPNQKPVDLMEWCLSRIKSKIVLDPYMGSGSTAVAAIRQGKKFIGVEINEKYFNVACQRVNETYKEISNVPSI